MNQQPRVTAVIPVHNHRDWVLHAVGSVVYQDYRPLRIVVVDDGSTDGSHEAVRKHLSSPRQLGPNAWVGVMECLDVLLLRGEQAAGPAAARNAGIRAAWDGTDLFALLDSDDIYLPGKIARSVAKFAEAPDHIGAVYSDYDTLRPDGLRVRQYKEPFSRERLVRECIVNCDSLVSRKALEAVGLLDESLRVCEDYDLWLRISEKFMLVHLPQSLLTIRVGEHSSSATVTSDTWRQCYARVMQKAQERMRGVV